MSFEAGNTAGGGSGGAGEDDSKKPRWAELVLGRSRVDSVVGQFC